MDIGSTVQVPGGKIGTILTIIDSPYNPPVAHVRIGNTTAPYTAHRLTLTDAPNATD